MGRTRKGRAVTGWLVVDKPAGLTSTAVVNKVKWALGGQKAGHAGTLDPDATGVLAVALGEATKTVPCIAEALKAYRFRVEWGTATATDDAAGAVVATSALRPTREAIETALPAFRGDITQVPPQVSAVKVDGARAYDLAREGEVMDLAPRPLHVARLDLLDCPNDDHADFEMICGKGGYVRSIARDLGGVLGCLGHVQSLRRVWSGPFRVEDAIPFAEVERLAGTPDLDAHLLPLEAALAGLPEVRATEAGAARLRHGGAGEVIPLGAIDWGAPVWVSHQGRAIALGVYHGGQVQPDRVIL